MAIIENGINGGFTVKVGTVTGYYLHGKYVIRSKRKTSNKNKIGSATQKGSEVEIHYCAAVSQTNCWFCEDRFQYGIKKANDDRP